METAGSGAAEAASTKEARKQKVAKQTSMTLFVIFLLVLLGFGHSPTRTYTQEDIARGNIPTGLNFYMQYGDGSTVCCNVPSILGVIMGAYALFFLARSYRQVMALSTLTKVLGLLGGAGLIVHAAIAILHPIS
jgi:hypothetical protein